jgi:lipopolysaccharide exporter
LLRFGVPAAIGTVLSQLVLNADYVIVAREQSAYNLGLYALAFNIASWPTAVLFVVIRVIVLPAFSTVRQNDGDLRSTVSRAIRILAFVACPIGAFTCAFAYPLVETLYGSKWSSAAPVLSILAPYGVLYVLTLLFDNIMIASGKTSAMFIVQLVALVSVVPALLFGIRVGGLAGVATAHILVILFVTLPCYAIVIFRITGADITTVLRAFARPLFAAVAATGIAVLVTFELDSAIGKLVIALIMGFFAYAAFSGRELLQLLPSRIADKRILLLIAVWPSLLRRRALNAK